MKEKEILRIANGVIPPAWLDDRVRFLIHFAQLVAAAEREACAKVCEDSVEYAGDTLAQAIRARGQQ